jgi:hypothetical protein
MDSSLQTKKGVKLNFPCAVILKSMKGLNYNFLRVEIWKSARKREKGIW